MHVIHRRGWEIPEREATPEHLVDRRSVLKAAGAIGAHRAGGRARAGAARRRPAGPERRALSGQAQRHVHARPAGHRRGDQHDLQQFLRVRLVQDDRARRPERSSCGRGRSRSTAWSRSRWRSASTISSPRCRWRSGSTAIAASRRGRWRSRGRAFRWRAWSSSRGRSARPSICAWRRSRIRPSRPGQRARLVSVALCRRAHHGGGDERARLPGHRRLRQAGGEIDGRAAASRGAVEVRLQVDQVDHPLQLRRRAAEELLAGAAGLRIRLLGERQSARCRTRAGARRARS